MKTEYVPSNKYEACDMLDRAYWHLRNRDIDGTLAARILINQLHNQIFTPEQVLTSTP